MMEVWILNGHESPWKECEYERKTSCSDALVSRQKPSLCTSLHVWDYEGRYSTCPSKLIASQRIPAKFPWNLHFVAFCCTSLAYNYIYYIILYISIYYYILLYTVTTAIGLRPENSDSYRTGRCKLSQSALSLTPESVKYVHSANLAAVLWHF